MKKTFFFLLAMASIQLNAQYHGEKAITAEQFSPWVVYLPMQYSGSYHFGFSEGESELRVFVWDTFAVAQKKWPVWRESLGRFVDTFANFSNVRVQGNQLFSDETHGEFLKLTDETGLRSGLLIAKPWTYQFQDGGEFGALYPDEEGPYLPGEFPQASTRIQDKERLKNLSLEQLQLMRNEIFARYGYAFKPGGKMDAYFSEKDWYMKAYENVDQWLTSIERHNIKTILEVEKEKRGE